jgi:hypothetical protein
METQTKPVAGLDHEEEALNKVFKRSYEGENDGEVIVAVGTRNTEVPDGLTQAEDYVEAEFVFKNGELITAHIGAVGNDVAKVPQAKQA